MARRRVSRSAVIFVSVICLLLATLGGLTVYTVGEMGRMKTTISKLEKDLSSQRTVSDDSSDELKRLQEENARLQATVEEKDALIEEQETTIEEKDALIEEQEGTIADQQEQIEEQQDTIDDLKVQIALKNTTPGDPNLPEHGEYDMYEGQKIVALTFDDGPGPYTAELLDFLKQEDVRVTFFVLGTRVDAYPKLIRRMAAEGHEIGNHSNAHNMLHKMDLLGVRNEMGKCAEKIEKLLGYRPSVMRCPGGNKNSAVVQYAEEAGIPIAYWSVDTLDWKSRDKDAILDVAFGKNGIKDGSIVLMHDIHKTTIPAAKEMILRLKEEGYVFVTTTELIAARRGGIVPGKQYS